MANLLQTETSPYLLQHKDNPVEWMPWGPEAFDRARREDKPIFLSVGYSSCHWCHVMAHESFEDDEVASVLNRSFVSVKVDREERPDVDEAYMTAVHLQFGRGGWPMSVFLTPDGSPFFAGTYFPKHDRGGYPGFLSLIRQLDAMWTGQRDKVEIAAREFRESLEEANRHPQPESAASLDWPFVERAAERILGDFDPVHGGFGKAPKFPPHSTLELCLKLSVLEPVQSDLRSRLLQAALLTLEKMCLGGIHDHIGGGFHRYSTDGVWLLPHFEKMLYDNALILRNLALALPLADGSRQQLFARAIEGTERWLKTEMVSPEGLFCSAIDADSEGEEGKFYVWSVEEVRRVLSGRADGFLGAYGFEMEGNFLDEATGMRSGANIPHLDSISDSDFSEELAALRNARARRERPLRDHKALIGWNGLALAGLAASGRLDLAEAILKALEHFWSIGKPLPHQIAAGRATGQAFLEDVAGLLWGLAELGRLQPEYVALAKTFRDPRGGAYFATTDAHEPLFGRSKPVFDQPIPSANALLARAFVRSGHLKEARQIVEASAGWIERIPGSTEAMLLAAVELFIAEAAGPASRPVDAFRPSEIVAMSLVEEEAHGDASGWAKVELQVQIRDGFHVNSHEPPAAWLKPTDVRVEGLEGHAQFPQGANDRYEGTFILPVMLKGRGEFEIIFTCQPCDDRACYEVVEKRLSGRVV